MKNLLLIFINVLLLSSCESTFFEPEPATNAEAVFEELWKNFDEMYAPFEERGVDWDALYAEFRPQLNANSTDEDLYRVVTQMITKLDDGHVSLTVPNKKVYFANRVFREKPEDDLYNKQVIQNNYLNGQFEEAEHTFYGKIGSIPYINLNVVNAEWNHLQDAIKLHPDAPGIIIDLRHNQGGDFTFAQQAVEKLNAEKRFLFKSRTKNGTGKDDFTDWHAWYLDAKGNFDGKILVLIDRYTVSAGERAALILKSLPNATLIGEATNGALSTMIPRGLSNGWYHTIATQDVIAFNGEEYEGKGIPADVRATNTLARLAQGKDDVLERALAELQ